jgi:IclR family transcriptional regulator, acetate operon repressor
MVQPDERSVLHRAFRILSAFDGERTEVSLAELAARTGLPKGTLHRLAAQLVEQSALERTQYGYQLGMRLFEIGGLVPRQRRLREIAIPFIEDLYEATHETIHFGVLAGTDVVYLERISGHNSIRLPTRAGGRLPAYCSGIGKAMLAFSPQEVVDTVIARGMPRRTPHTISTAKRLQDALERVRELGVAYDLEEGKLGVACVAAPVFNNEKRPVAALSVTTTAPRLHERLTPGVLATALSLSRAIRRMPDSHWDRRHLPTDIV